MTRITAIRLILERAMFIHAVRFHATIGCNAAPVPV
jgi:hypothetical protein